MRSELPTAVHLVEGVTLAVVSKLLRHSDPAITLGTYGHLDVEDLRQAVDRLPFGAANAPVPGSDEPDSVPRFGAPVARNSRSVKNEGRDASEIPSNVAAFRKSGRQDLNLRPLAPQVMSPNVHILFRLRKVLERLAAAFRPGLEFRQG